ncbi:MAG: PhnD/SsuA/transferrin family substrate-binding protein [Arenimonas sp.]|nr:PhnD/SsuA/transferrin family substrate-binding protein [Arenimonas sp.]MBP7916927.1 PhnD/SsuA/transferrin family substrate-binding protein [Arenimonas sp.]
MLRRSLLAISLSAFSISAMAANYTISVEPNYPASQAQEIYKPLLSYLSKSTGHTFTLKTANNYHAYWRDVLANTPTDFTFEESHFADFRIQRFGFLPLVRVAEPTQFSLLVSPENKDKGIQGLFSGTIVSMPSPSLGYLFLGELFPNPIAQPEISSTAQTWKDGVDSVFAMEAAGAIVPVYIAQQYPNLESVFLSRSLPGRSMNATRKVPADVRNAVTNAMLKLHQNAGLIDVLTELGTTQFIKTNAADVYGNERMLRRAFGYPKSTLKAKPAPAAKPAAVPAPAAAVKK